MSRKNLCSLLPVLLLLTCWFGAAEAKKFVVTVGPHETHTGTTSFLARYAANDGSGDSVFDGWSWPIIESEDIDASPQHVFDLLVKDQGNADLQDTLIDGIKSAWTDSEKGVFIGSLDFDKVGENPYSGYDAVQALTRVVDEVGISAEDVVVVVTYQRPRVNQWRLVWQNHFNAASYEDFVCSDEQSNKRWEWLDTSMNPFKLATAYYDQGWSVVMLDQDSINKSGKDVPNVVACLAMENKNCDDGKVEGLDDVVPKTSLEDGIDELGATDHDDLEKMFLFRDCFYYNQINNSSRFELFAKSSDFESLQSQCKNSLETSYAQLADTNFFMNAIQSQKYCENDDIDVESLLSDISDGSIVNDDGFYDDDITFDDITYDDIVEPVGSTSEEDTLFGSEIDNDGPVSESIGDEAVEDEDSVASTSTSSTSTPASDNEIDSTSTSTNDNEIDSSSTPAIDNDDGSTTTFNGNKKLVVFAGPHETEATDVLRFFVENDESLSHWTWPRINSELIWRPDHRVFDFLVAEPDNEDVQSVVTDGIVEAMENTSNGVIMGSLDFAWVGENPYTQYDPVGALRRVVDRLGIADGDVSIALTYRAPRIDHWSVVWHNHFDSDDYKDFICSDGEQSSKRWEWLDTVMNPFKIAKAYHDQGWNVAVIDQEGTLTKGRDVAHTIACNLMEGVNCNDGWAVGLENVVGDSPEVIPMDSMSDGDRRDLEELFRQRDCYYKYQLKDKPGFAIVNQRSAWSSCQDHHQAFYEEFTDTDFMLNVLQSQKQCAENNVDIEKLLETKVIHGDKQLVVFAGPHETSAVPVTRFFVDHASDEVGTNRSTSLDGWSWPVVDSEIITARSHRTFDLLLSDADTRPVQNIIMDGIRDSWNEAENGVIIGSLDFDRVGKNPYTNYDALEAIDRVDEMLGINDNDVTVVLNYRSARLDHLSAVWYNHFEAETFQDFVCSDEEADMRWEWIDTVMNPLKLANAYLEEGWNVVIIDQEGTASAGKDVAHALACNIMNGVDCDNGWVRGLRSETIEEPTSYDLDGVDYYQRHELETLFHMRDCFYKDTLQSDNKFSVVNRDEIWKSCSTKRKETKKYEQLADTDFLIEVMKSLQDCGDASNRESSEFASELLTGTTSYQNFLMISVAFLTFVSVIALCYACKKRNVRRKKIEQAKINPTEGVFRDDPDNVGSSGPYRDNESAANETLDETMEVDSSEEDNFQDCDDTVGESQMEDDDVKVEISTKEEGCKEIV